MENVLTVLLIVSIIVLIVILVLIVHSLYTYIIGKIYTPQKQLKNLLKNNVNNIIHINIIHAKFNYGVGGRVYALLDDKYLSIDVSSDVTLTVSKEPVSFYHGHVDTLLNYVSLYTDKPVVARYEPEK